MAKRTIITLFEIPCESFGDPDLNVCERCLLWAACVRYDDINRIKPVAKDEVRHQHEIKEIFDELGKSSRFPIGEPALAIPKSAWDTLKAKHLKEKGLGNNK